MINAICGYKLIDIQEVEKMKMYYKFVGIHDACMTTKEENNSFNFLIQRAILLALKEAGVLNMMQHRLAEGYLENCEHISDVQ